MRMIIAIDNDIDDGDRPCKVTSDGGEIIIMMKLMLTTMIIIIIVINLAS